MDAKQLKILIILVILGMVGGLGGVGALVVMSQPGGRPARVSLADDLAVRQTAGNYLQAWQDSAPERMYTHLSEADKARVTPAEYKQQFEAFPVYPLHFRLGTVKSIGADRAAITVRILWPEPEHGIEKDEQIVLIRENSAWRILERESMI